MDVTIVTSLYRSGEFLNQYVSHLLAVGSELHQAGLALEVILIANDALSFERERIADLIQAAAPQFQVQPIYVAREPLYASWNRGIQAASGRSVTMWNVDDIRTSEALIDGHRRIVEGCRLVDFTSTLVYSARIFGRAFVYQRVKLMPLFYDHEGNNPVDRKRTGPFFMFERSLYDEVGAFDTRFKIAGDFEWIVRAAQLTDFCASPVHAGLYVIHGGNISAGALMPAEENVVLMLHPHEHEWQHLRPVSPKVMRETWSRWNSVEIPPEIQDRLWGAAAEANYRRRKLWRTVLPPSLWAIAGIYIDKHHLRPLLSRLGLVNRESTVALADRANSLSDPAERR